MKEFVFVVLFFDKNAEESDPDREWPACFSVKGENYQVCYNWGKHLSETYATDNELEILSIELEEVESSKQYYDTLPKLVVGESYTDRQIGW
ncbi:hypothetical protein [Leptospira mtsangambouensis]|uniref:hypothetical protein n=1 Tax=Leptospira mtsangambouensis TaxID=2484912 RepID=UPI001EECE7E6|nr:hypothetical protein [Leptospira mtsangambouensis]MCG6138965.1 hypothetical protein [Leptospira mtsangambouensis]